ncbi:MAG: hypothetical protein KME45_24980 [Stenomitos rutilans HA7619-LM2]|nr:hypothetical protein [Stenomitos rutilans HA7619-LM2]
MQSIKGVFALRALLNANDHISIAFSAHLYAVDNRRIVTADITDCGLQRWCCRAIAR